MAIDFRSLAYAEAGMLNLDNNKSMNMVNSVQPKDNPLVTSDVTVTDEDKNSDSLTACVHSMRKFCTHRNTEHVIPLLASF